MHHFIALFNIIQTLFNIKEKSNKQNLVPKIESLNIILKDPSLIDKDTKDKDGNSFLLQALKNNQLSIANLFINYDADVNLGENLKGTTPLIFTAYNGDEEMTLKLLEAGAKVNLPNKTGFTPIFMAAGMGHLRVVEILLMHGAQTNHIASDGTTLQSFIDESIIDNPELKKKMTNLIKKYSK